MEREKSCVVLKIVFELLSGLFLIAGVTLLGGRLFDLPIVVLITILIGFTTAMLVRQDKQILDAVMADGINNY